MRQTPDPPAVSHARLISTWRHVTVSHPDASVKSAPRQRSLGPRLLPLNWPCCGPEPLPKMLRPDPVLVCDPPQRHPLRVLSDSGAGAMVPAAPNFAFGPCCAPFVQPSDTPWQHLTLRS